MSPIAYPLGRVPIECHVSPLSPEVKISSAETIYKVPSCAAIGMKDLSIGMFALMCVHVIAPAESLYIPVGETAYRLPSGSAKILWTCPPGGACPCVHCAIENLEEFSWALDVETFSKVCELVPLLLSEDVARPT